ncbi:hypothetical protein CFIO01_01994 [Colletotrichum fioriniae PJ7]|uniref:Uncharacterized protein n=1 Tax=Colletotrichum fioriniae PJ7 TaxID=1445577 RepID=A0A010R2N0_9PEZI|nr:hypothetical protein CFIO01_01994 [Colletotrichum fioriniae PJ7]
MEYQWIVSWRMEERSNCGQWQKTSQSANGKNFDSETSPMSSTPCALHPPLPLPISQVPKSESVLPPLHPCLAAQASSLDATSFRTHQRGPPPGSPGPGATLSRHFDDDDDDHNHGLQLPPSPNLVRSILQSRGIQSAGFPVQRRHRRWQTSPHRWNDTLLSSLTQPSSIFNHLRGARPYHHRVTSSRG